MRMLMTAVAVAFGAQAANAQDATYAVRLLTPETALRAAQAALETCRKAGFQVAVAVVDRGGTTQVLLRDRFAGPHTVEVAPGKAWTALTFKQDTLSLNQASRSDGPAAPIRHIPRAVVIGGGVPIEAGGSLLGAIGVSGAPGGEADDECAKAGIESVRQDIEF